MAQNEVDGAFGLMTEMAKMSVPEEVVEENEQRKVVVRYTPLGSSNAAVRAALSDMPHRCCLWNCTLEL
jgi:hypothetical protein